jgi:hypothetical protein
MTGQQQKAKIVMRERERERERYTLVKLKTKHLICNMIFFEIIFLLTRVMYMFAQVFEVRVNPYHPPLHHPLDAYCDSMVEELHPS